MAIIDLHCHIDLYDDPKTILDRAEQAGIYVLSVTTTPKAWPGTNRMAKTYGRVQTSLGLHPQLAHERYNELPLFERLLSEVNYVGEIGLDKSQHYKQHIDIQQKVFTQIMCMVNNAGGKIMTIHSRNAAKEILDELEKWPNAGPAILHWFSGSINQLNRAIDLGCWFSIGPKMIESKNGRELIKQMPSEKILFETDGPFAKGRDGTPFEPRDTLKLPELLSSILEDEPNTIRNDVLNNFRNLTSTYR